MNDGPSETTQAIPVEAAKGRTVSPLLKLALEFGPLAIFFLANSYGDRLFGVSEDRRIFVATGVFIVASLIALAASRALMGYLPRMAIVNAVVVTVFGGLTLALDEATQAFLAVLDRQTLADVLARRGDFLPLLRQPGDAA